MAEPSKAGEWNLLGGALAFDFANMASEWEATAAAGNPQSHSDIVAWASHAGLLNAVAETTLEKAIRLEPRFGVRLFGMARDLRDAIHEVGVAFANGRRPSDADMATLKDYYGRSVGAAALIPDDQAQYVLDFSAAPPEFIILGPIAASALDVVTSADKSRVKQCPACGWLFIDKSKNRSRRWCDMSTCGNRMKGRKHRERHG